MTSVKDHTDAAVDEIPVLDIVVPFPGFPEHRRFALAQLDEAGLMYALRSMDDPDLRFVVVPPGAFFEDYSPEIDDDSAAALEATSEDDLLTLVIVTPGDTLSEATANLLAPVVINHRTRLAAQIVLDDSSLAVRAPPFPEGPPRDQHTR